MEFFYDNNRDGAWDTNRDDTVRTLREHFVPVILDSYLPGTPAEKAFVDRLGRGGANCLVVAAASGKQVGTVTRPGELMKVVEQFRAMPETERKPVPEQETKGPDTDQVPPALPEGGLTLIAYQVPLTRGPGGELVRAPDLMAPGPCWKLRVPITMNDLVWGTPEERKALLLESAQKGQKVAVPPSLVRRLFVTQAYDWMLGYQNNTLRVREGELTATVEEVSAKEIRIRLEGISKVGGTEEELRACPCTSPRGCDHWGCELRYTGVVRIDRTRRSFAEFRVVGLGETWSKVKRAELKYGPEVVRYPTGLLVELPSDCPANRGGWPPLAPTRLNVGFDYWGSVRK